MSTIKKAIRLLKYKEKCLPISKRKRTYELIEAIKLKEVLEEIDHISKVKEGMLSNKYAFQTYYKRKKNGTYRKIVAPSEEYKKDNRRILEFLNRCKRLHIEQNKGISSIYPRIQSSILSSVYKENAIYIKVDIKKAFDDTSEDKIRKAFIRHLKLDVQVKEIRELLGRLIEDIIIATTLEGNAPQGFPTSPILFEMCIRGIETKIAHELMDTVYIYTMSRYIDDILLIGKIIQAEPEKRAIKETKERIKDIVKRTINRRGYLVNLKKLKVVARGDKDQLHHLGACIYHYNDININRNKIRIRKKTRNKQRIYEYIGSKYNKTLSKAVAKGMKSFC